ncbi:MAG: hypothetical protein EHM40_06515 [Chloroflexi bacterium]|nr:MAG: hypothetical protein EHM40_06515 [Chloroflexota bacterium]
MTVQPAERKRGGCLTAFLIAMLIINPLVGLYYLFAGSTLRETLPSLPEWRISVLTILALANFAFAIGIWNWKRWGVFGFAGSALVAFLINAIQFGFVGALSGLIGVVLLAVLVVPIWNQMD